MSLRRRRPLAYHPVSTQRREVMIVQRLMRIRQRIMRFVRRSAPVLGVLFAVMVLAAELTLVMFVLG